MTDAVGIVRLLAEHTFVLSRESLVHEGIAEVLAVGDVIHEREYVDGRNRYDFFCRGGIVIEVKVGGSMGQALRQVERYCQSQVVAAVIIATTKAWVRTGRSAKAAQLCGKDVYVCRLRGRAF